MSQPRGSKPGCVAECRERQQPEQIPVWSSCPTESDEASIGLKNVTNALPGVYWCAATKPEHALAVTIKAVCCRWGLVGP